jgi:flagellin-specific chaperone FliS
VNLSDEHVQEFIEAWKGDFDETLSSEVARSEAARLLDFFVWMTEELNVQEALKPKETSVVEPAATENKSLKEAWRKTMRQRF